MEMKKTTKKRKKSPAAKRITNHHILPTSRGGKQHRSNIAKVANRKHEIYHMLFCNMTPVEIIVYLVDYFWAGQWNWVELALERRKKDEPE